MITATAFLKIVFKGSLKTVIVSGFDRGVSDFSFSKKRKHGLFNFLLCLVLVFVVLIGSVQKANAITTNINTNSSQAAAGNPAAGTTNVLLYYFTLNVTVGNSTFTSISNFTTSGTYVAADITNLKLWVSNFEFFGGGTLTNIATLTGAGIGPGTHTFNFTNPLPTGVVQRYFWVTCDVASNAICTHTIKCDLITNAMLIIPATKNYGTNNAAGLQTITGGGCVVLPIELLYFKGENTENGNVLEWQTASETNNDFFTLERSIDGEKFGEVINIKGAGNSFETKFYSFIDDHLPLQSVLYYRLRQTDLDASISFSNMIALELRYAKEKPPDFYFDPDLEQLIVTWNFPKAGNFIFEVCDLSGRKIMQKTVEIEQNGTASISIAFSSATCGIFIGEISGAEKNRLARSRFVIGR